MYVSSNRLRLLRSGVPALLLLAVLAQPVAGWPASNAAPAAIPDAFLALLTGDGNEITDAFTTLDHHWDETCIPMALETLYLSRNLHVTGRLVELLQQKSGQTFGFDIGKWQEWLWSRPGKQHPRYADFKSRLYRTIDPRFAHYFAAERPREIRLDEIVWGGVRQDGIPPLRQPRMIGAAAADYLKDDNVIFGVEINGDVRAYPKRIMAWHEMFVDEVGGIPVTGAYCTLCGAMILYRSGGHQLGTSGFLYRSNKLMYDQATQSLWNTLWGTPVVGPLVGKGIALERLSIVTTTWGEWRRRHPDTQVLSLDTGYARDYREGVAYFEYFLTDELMFAVPGRDSRLPNKDEILGLVFAQAPDQPLAISARYLHRHPVYHDAVGPVRFVVLTDRSGANRVYDSADVRFVSWDRDRVALDDEGKNWTLTEAALVGPDGRTLHRLPAHRAFWFGWFSAYAHTRLVK